MSCKTGIKIDCKLDVILNKQIRRIIGIKLSHYEDRLFLRELKIYKYNSVIKFIM